MKIIVFSDSHRNSYNMKKAIDIHASAADYFFHLGDGTDEFNMLSSNYDKPFICVSGNYEDYSLMFQDIKPPNKMILELDGYRFMLTHGHRYGINEEINIIKDYAVKEKIDVVLFGHTHVKMNAYFSEYKNPLRLFNPGSISLPRDGSASYGIIEIRNHDILLTNAII